MLKKKIVLDINTHIQNISASISNSSLQATVSFDNLGYGTITAVKFKAKGYNSFGDIVTINGKDTFYLVIQDLNILKNTAAKDIKINLPNNEIRKLELEEHQICFSDGSICTYAGNDSREFEVDEYEMEGEDKEKLLALRDKFGSQYKYKPKLFDCGWICCCGTYNNTERTTCHHCGCNKDALFQSNDDATIGTLIEEYHIAERKRAEQKERDAIQKAKESKTKKIKIAIGAVAAILVLILIIYAIVMGGRSTYSSESEMRTALQGTYTYYNDSGTATRQIVISGDTATYKWKYGSDMETTIREWNYKNGTIHTFETLVVTSEGHLKDGGDVYKKGGYMSSGSSSSSSYESAYSVLKISGVKVTTNSSYTVCTGTITNNGKNTYKYVKVKGSFKNSSGTVLDTDWTYAVGSEGLAPGESKTFRMSVPKDYDIKSCSVSITDYD